MSRTTHSAMVNNQIDAVDLANLEREEAHAAALSALSYARGMDDTERAHQDADQALLDLLMALGYRDVVEAWENVPKWGA